MTHLTDDSSHLHEELLSSETLFDGHFFSVQNDRVRLADGQEAPRQYITHPGAVAIIAVLADGSIVLERQYRHPVREVVIEIPAGKLDAGEAPLLCAQRELLEETGYRATRWTALGVVNLAVGYSSERLWYFLAEDLSLHPRQLDHGEQLDVFSLPAADFASHIRSGQINDAKTITGWTLWRLHAETSATQ